MQKIVTVKTSSREYDITIARGLLPSQGPEGRLAAVVGGRRCLIVSDSNVAELYGPTTVATVQRAGAEHVGLEAFTAGEASKTLATVEEFYHLAVGHRLDRSSVVVGLGGGVTGDMAGFIAATYMRGIDFIQIPTSLLAMVDSSVGGKVGVDLPEGKNLIGAFYQPQAVLIDLNFLKTLPERELLCGLAEVVKYGVIMDAALFHLLSANVENLLARDPDIYAEVVARCCQLKAEVVAADEREESGRRALLNYGHTFGHALETLGGYNSGLNHGEAIAVGMGMAADLATAIGLAAPELVAEQDTLLRRLGLPVRIRQDNCTPEAVIEAMGRDKKVRNGRLKLVLPYAIGRAQIVADVKAADINLAIGGRRD